MINLTSLKSEPSSFRRRNGRRKRTATSILGDKYMTTARTKSDGWFRPCPNQFLMAPIIPVGFSQVYAYVTGNITTHRAANVNFRTYLSLTANSIVLLALQLNIISSVAVNTNKKYSKHSWTWTNYVAIMKGGITALCSLKDLITEQLCSWATKSLTFFHSKSSCVKLLPWQIPWPIIKGEFTQLNPFFRTRESIACHFQG